MQSPPDFLLVALGEMMDYGVFLPGIKTKSSQNHCFCPATQGTGDACWNETPPNYGATHLEAFENMFPELADELKIPLLPFLLEGVGGNRK